MYRKTISRKATLSLAANKPAAEPLSSKRARRAATAELKSHRQRPPTQGGRG